MKITLVTGNPKKKAEAEALLAGVDFEMRDVDVAEIQSFSIEEIVETKARAAFALVGGPVLVDDVAFDCSVLGGFPGPFVKFWLNHVGYDRAAEIAVKMGDQRATVRCGVGFCDGERVLYVEGAINGMIIPKRGTDGFGFDPYFVPEGHDQSFAEMGPEKKNTLSHRFLAFSGMRQKLVEAGILL